MEVAALADTGLLDYLCRAPRDADRDGALHAAAHACLSAPGARRAWARLRSDAAEASWRQDRPGSLPYGLEVPVRVAGEICGTVGLEANQPVNGHAHRRANDVAEVLATWEARRCLLDAGEQTIVGCSPAIRRVELLARRLASLDEPVLIEGETGVGKELVARTIHCLSPRAAKPLSAINCAAVPEELMVSELFGHRRGAFTGAVRNQRGRFEVADGATLFLDEVGDMGPRLQAALLRVIEYGEIQRLGDESGSRRISVRIIAATNKDLAAEVETGRFRRDLYYRLSALTIHVPPLRERPEDVSALTRHFVGQLEDEWGRSLETVDEAVEQLGRYPFPGNVRELRNLVLRAAAVCADGRIHRFSVPPMPRTPGADEGAREPRARGSGRPAPSRSIEAPMPYFPAGSVTRRTGADYDGAVCNTSGPGGAVAMLSGADGTELSLRAATVAHLKRVLSMAEGNVSKAARMLEIPRTTLQSKLERYGVAS